VQFEKKRSCGIVKIRPPPQSINQLRLFIV
jgi:hypothetical protein